MLVLWFSYSTNWKLIHVWYFVGYLRYNFTMLQIRMSVWWIMVDVRSSAIILWEAITAAVSLVYLYPLIYIPVKVLYSLHYYAWLSHTLSTPPVRLSEITKITGRSQSVNRELGHSIIVKDLPLISCKECLNSWQIMCITWLRLINPQPGTLKWPRETMSSSIPSHKTMTNTCKKSPFRSISSLSCLDYIILIA